VTWTTAVPSDSQVEYGPTALLTVAVNCCVPLAVRVEVRGEREILIAEAVARVLSPPVTRTPLASLERTRK